MPRRTSDVVGFHPIENRKSKIKKAPSVAAVGEEVDLAATEFAGHFHAEVFDGHAELFGAIRAVGIERDRFRGGAGEVDTERTRAELAGNTLSDVLTVDPQFFVAMWAKDVVPRG
jgi:hypothetical protein